MDRAAFLSGITNDLSRQKRREEPAAADHLPRSSRLTAGHGSLIDLFVTRLTAAGGEGHRVATRDEARGALLRMLGAHDGASVVCSPDLSWPGLEASRVSAARDASFGLCEAAHGIAETGSVLLRHGGRSGRTHSLLPAAVGFFLPASRIVASLGRALDSVLDADGGAPACYTLITGVSHSADIACIPVRGVHGPGEVHVWIIGGE